MRNFLKTTSAATAFESESADGLGNSKIAPIDSSAEAFKKHINPAGEFEYSLKKEGVTNFVAKSAIFENGSLQFSEGLVVSGQVLGGSLHVHGTLIVREGATVNAAIQCNRLINMGDINSSQVVVKGLVVAWAGNLRTKDGLFCESMHTSNYCQVSGPLKDISELMQ
jgi:hypothetical protein